MTLQKTLETLRDLLTTLPQTTPEERREAVNIGIKAIERFRNLRAANHYVGMPLLKGETLENPV